MHLDNFAENIVIICYNRIFEFPVMCLRFAIICLKFEPAESCHQLSLSLSLSSLSIHKHSEITGLQGKREGISLTPNYTSARFTDT